MKTPILILFVLLQTTPFLIAQPNAGSISGAAIFCDTLNTGFISLSNFSGTIIKWQLSGDLINWTDINNITSTQHYFHLKNTTSFRALVGSTGIPSDTSAICTVSVHTSGESGSLVGGGTFCEKSSKGSIALSGYSGNILDWQNSTDEGITWQSLNQSGNSIQFDNLTKSTWYRCILNTFTVCPNDTAQPLLVKIDRTSAGGFLSGSDTVCPNTGTIVLQLTNVSGAIVNWYELRNDGIWAPVNFRDSIKTIIAPEKNNTFKVEVKNGVCNSAFSSIGVAAVFAAAVADAGPDQSIKRFDEITLTGNGNGFANWWPTESLAANDQYIVTANPLKTTRYKLFVTTENGCLATDSVLITVEIPIPTAFTPNNDGVNDFFEIEDIDLYKDFNLQVINRQGVVVFSAKPYLNNWSGQNNHGEALPNDVYFYSFSAPDGSFQLTNSVLIKR